MKKTIALLFIAFAVLAFTGCDGLMHNTPMSYVTFSFVNFDSLADGTTGYVVGNFKDSFWGAGFVEEQLVTFAGGNADLTTPMAITTGDFMFTLSMDSNWNRPWKGVDTTGNAEDGNNFSTTVAMDGGTHNITVDAEPAAVSVVAD